MTTLLWFVEVLDNSDESGCDDDDDNGDGDGDCDDDGGGVSKVRGKGVSALVTFRGVSGGIKLRGVFSGKEVKSSPGMTSRIW